MAQTLDYFQFIDACHYPDNKMCRIKHFISIGVDVNEVAYNGTTMLHLVSNKGCVNCVSMLLNAGAHPNIIDVYGESPLHDAIIHEQDIITKILIDRGASIHNVRLIGRRLKTIPNWIYEFIEERIQMMNRAMTIIGIHKFKRTTIPIIRDVVKHIGKHIWSYRLQ
jgi:ankyrin repeat protein